MEFAESPLIGDGPQNVVIKPLENSFGAEVFGAHLRASSEEFEEIKANLLQ